MPTRWISAKVDVLIGGGEDEGLPTSETGCYPEYGERSDSRNLINKEIAYPFSPTVAEMTQKAIDILSQNPSGFFLMVEGGQFDGASHSNNAEKAINTTVGLDEAVNTAKKYAETSNETLIIVTADHETGGMITSLSQTMSPNEDGPFYMPNGTPFYVNWASASHTASDVPTTALGPSSCLLAGTNENTFIHDVMQYSQVQNNL